MNDLISRKALLAEYDRVHIGEPGQARTLIENAPAVDAPHWATEQAYKNGYEAGKRDALNGVGISNLETATQWIPVSERLPNPFVPVLVYRKSFGTLPPYVKVDKMILDIEDTQVWTDEVGNWKGVTTHWMPLPEPPKGE